MINTHMDTLLTFRKSLPCFVQKTNLNSKRVCVSMKCFNFEAKPHQYCRCQVAYMPPVTLRTAYNDSMCKYNDIPDQACVQGTLQRQLSETI